MDQLRDAPQEKVTERPQVAQRRSRSWVPWTIFLLLLAIAGAIWWQRPFFGQEPVAQKRATPPVSVGVATVDKGNINVTLDALGTVTSLATVTVKTQISGQLVAVDFQEGQDVKKGDLLAQIDPRPFQAALAQAQGQLARDQALLQGAQVDLKRYQGLAAQNAVPRQTLDTQVALVAQDQGTVEADKAMVQAATVNLDFTSIRSPLDGRTGLRQVDQGNYVTPTDGAGIVVITQIQPISVLFTVPEDQLRAIAQRLHEGATLPVTAFDRTGNNKLAEGELQTFDSQIDPTTGTIKLRASFGNENRALYPNQFVNIELIVNEHKDVAIAPTAAVQRGVPGTFVYLVNADNTVSVRKIALGVTEGVRVEILSGINPGDRVVVDGADKLREGAHIAVREVAQPPAQTQPATPPPQPAEAQPASANPPDPDASPASDVPATPGVSPKHKGQGGGKHQHSGAGQPQ
jgi:multidrug efflux system membrane fusion protein